MRRFTDSKGRGWDVAINVLAVKRVRGMLGVDLNGLITDGARPLAALLDDPCQLVDVLYVLCRNQAEDAGITDEQFGEAMGGDSLSRAADAFLEELIDFFREPRARASLRKLIAAGKQAGSLALDEAERVIQSLDPALLARTLTGSPGSSPGPSESIQAP